MGSPSADADGPTESREEDTRPVERTCASPLEAQDRDLLQLDTPLCSKQPSGVHRSHSELSYPVDVSEATSALPS